MGSAGRHRPCAANSLMRPRRSAPTGHYHPNDNSIAESNTYAGTTANTHTHTHTHTYASTDPNLATESNTVAYTHPNTHPYTHADTYF